MTAQQADLPLLNLWQRDFPLVRAPFARIGASLGLDAQSVLSRYAHLQGTGALSRIGAIPVMALRASACSCATRPRRGTICHSITP